MLNFNGDFSAPRYRRSAMLIILLALLLGAAHSAMAAATALAGPASPQASVWCVRDDVEMASNAPCSNPTTFTSIGDAVAAASAGDEIRIMRGPYAESVNINKPLTLYGGFNGNADDWGSPRSDCSNVPSCTRIGGNLTVAGSFTVTLNGITIGGNTVNSSGGTISAFGSGIRLGEAVGTYTINGKWNIAAPGFIEIVASTQIAQAGTQIVGDGWLHLYQDGVLNVAGNLSVPRLNHDWGDSRGGYVEGPGVLNVTSHYLWNGGEMRGTGVTNLMPGATMDVTQTRAGAPGYIDSRTFNNRGTVNWDQGYPLLLSHGATFNNSGVFNLQHSYNLDISTLGAGGAFVNSGVLRSMGAVYRQIHKLSEEVLFENSGAIDVPDAGGTLHFQIGTFNIRSGSAVSGNGFVQLGESNGTWNVSGPLTVPKLRLVPTANCVTCSGITGTATISISSVLEWNAGTMGGAGVTRALPGATTTIQQFSALYGRSFDNRGAVTFADHGTLIFYNAAAFDNHGSVTSTEESNALAADSGGSGTFTNSSGATFTKTAGHNFRAFAGITFVNAGTLNLAPGQLRMQGALFRQTGGVTNLAAEGGLMSDSLSLQLEGGSVDGTGSINCERNCSVINSGAVISPGNSPGVLTINGPYTQGPDATLKIEIGGATAGTQYDRLVVNGSASLAGTLQLNAINGYTLPRDTAYQVLQYQSHSGSFSSVSDGFYVNYGPGGADASAMIAVNFSDVQPGDYFYEPALYLAGRGVVSGYADGTFRPYANTTRGQLAKIVVLAEGWTPANPATPSFSDVGAGSTFFGFIEAAVTHGIISGYSQAAQCAPDATPCFKPFNNVTRGQLSKIIVLAEGWTLASPANPTFGDVPSSNPFYREIETAVEHGIISGYDVAAGREFRWGNPATRGQISKIVYGAVTAGAASK